MTEIMKSRVQFLKFNNKNIAHEQTSITVNSSLLQLQHTISFSNYYLDNARNCTLLFATAELLFNLHI